MREIISHYKILAKLGAGGMGVVYKAEDLKLKRLVALKFLPTELTHNAEAKERFIQEAQSASALDHPNICTIHEIDETDDGQMFIVMAYYEGETLQKKVSSGQLSVVSAIEFAIQIAQGLAKAHEHGIVHRDIKPANVIITKDGVVKIVDFGLAKLASQPRLTKTGSTVGTMAYMSPEQARGEAVDHRADIWALGVVLYEMLTGQLPFNGELEHAVMYAILNREPLPIRQVNPDLPMSLVVTVNKALEKRSVARFQRIEEVLENLKIASSEIKNRQGSARGFNPLQGWKILQKRTQKKAGLFFLVIFFIISAFVAFEVWKLNLKSEPKSPQRIIIAVMYFDNNTNDPELRWLSRGIPDMLITELSQSQYIRIISPEKMAEIERTNVNQKVTTIPWQSARLAGANALITGNAIKVEGELRLFPKLYDLDADSIFTLRSVSSKDYKTIFEMVDFLATQVKLALEIKASNTAEIAIDIVRAKTTSVEAYKHYILGTEYLDKSEYEEAINRLLKAVQYDSSFAFAYSTLANVYDILGEPALAERFIHKALEFSARLSSIDQLKIRVKYAQLKNDWDTALSHLKQLAVLQPDEVDWHFYLGWHYATHLRSHENSIREYKKAIEIEPRKQPRLYYYLGHAYLNYGRREEAVQTFQIYVTMLPNDAKAHDALGMAYLLTGDYENGLKEFEQALQLNPNFLTAFSNLGDLYFARGMRNEALKQYRRYLDNTIGQNKEKRGHYHLAKFFLENDDLASAAQRIQKVLELDSLMIEGLWLDGMIRLERKELDAASEIAKRMERILNKTSSAYTREFLHHLQGKIKLAQNRPDSALPEFEKAIQLGPQEQAYFRYAVAEAYFQKNDWGGTIQACKTLLAYNPQYAPAFILLAKSYEKMDGFDQAIRAYESCLEIWKDADENLPALMEIRTRLSSLKSRL